MSKKVLIIFFLSSVLLSFALYGNTIKSEFVYDDLFFVRRSELRQPISLINVWQQSYLPNNQTAVAYRPLPVFTFALNYVLFGESPVSFHIVNIILNSVVVFLLFLVVWELFKKKILAIFTAVFYAFLPIHTEAVAFVKARDDILATLFSLLAWLVFIKSLNRDKINIWGILLASLLWIVAVLGKEIAIVMPALFVLVFWIQNKVNVYKVIKTACLFIPATFLYFLVRFLVLGKQFLDSDFVYYIFDPLRYVDFSTRIWTAFKIAYIYIGNILVPVNLSATYTYNHLKLVSNPLSSIETILGIFVLGGILFLIVNKKTRNTFGIGALAFVIPYIMLSKFFVQVSEIASEKWMYLPSIGISLIVGFIFYYIFQYKKWLAILAFIGVLAFYTPILIKRNTIWTNQESFAKSMVKDAPDSAFGHFALAEVYYKQHKYKESKMEIAKSLNIHQDYAPVMDLVLSLALKEGNGAVASYALKKSIDLKPNELSALLLSKEGRYQESLDLISTFDPRIKERKDTIFLLALNYYKLGMLEESKKYFYWDMSKSEEEKINILKDF